jgi:phage baseplate assembly protein W
MLGVLKKMGSINFNGFKNTNYSQKQNTYTDIFLDLYQEPFELQIGNQNVSGYGKDIKVAYDLNAIKNSLINLFNTLPGHRILLPDYGCDLRAYLFDNITDTTARQIGRDIIESINTWEPRVAVININVNAYVNRHEYEITLVLEVPFINDSEKLNISGTLNKEGFIINNG